MNHFVSAIKKITEGTTNFATIENWDKNYKSFMIGNDPVC